tara:strand:+ start:720 stop:1061 length:342 start_codon:yes stop_codon:yes gene_type:complete
MRIPAAITALAYKHQITCARQRPEMKTTLSICTFWIYLAACSSTADRDNANSLPANVSASSNQTMIHFGIIARYNPVLMYRNYQPMMDYLSNRTPYQFELKLGKTYEDALAFL